MTTSLRRPVVACAAALAVLLTAVILDQGSAEGRDAALIIGSLALYLLIPATVIWLAVAAVIHRRR
jgi:hypothetical protein